MVEKERKEGTCFTILKFSVCSQQFEDMCLGPSAFILESMCLYGTLSLIWSLV